MSTAETAEPNEIPTEVIDSGWPREPCIVEDPDPHGKGQFLRISGPLKSIMSDCCGVRSKNNNSTSATAVAYCIATEWPHKNPFVMRPLVKII